MEKNRKRAKRRHHMWRMKARHTKYWYDHGFGRWTGEGVQPPSDHWLGNMYSTHGKPCSCSLGCGNARSHYGTSMAEYRQAGYWPLYE